MRTPKRSTMSSPQQTVAGRFFRFFFMSDLKIAHSKRSHLQGMIIPLLFLVLPVFLDFKPEEREDVRVLSVKLPPTCMSRYLFKAPCPGCGLTRSFALTVRGRLADATRYHRLGPVLWLFFLGQLAFRFHCLCRLDKPIPAPLAWLYDYTPVAMAMALLLNWLAALFVGSN